MADGRVGSEVGEESPSPMRLTDPRAMRALAHPVRLALVEALAFNGPLTATEAGKLVTQSATTCSFHLRQLAKYGIVEEAGPGPGRSRPWRLVALGWSTVDSDESPSYALADQLLSQATLSAYVERHNKWQEGRARLPDGWRQVGGQSQTVWWVTLEEASAIERELKELFFRYRDRIVDRSCRPEGAKPVEVVAFTHIVEGLTDR